MRHAAVAALALGILPVPARAEQLDFCGPADRACARLPVPLDPTGGVPGNVTLHLERMRAKAPTDAPLFLLAGGPGQSATRAFPRDAVREILGPVLRRRDLVVLDQRGTGSSGVLSCPELQRAGALDGAAAAACAIRLGPGRAFYTTRDSVADIDAVRRSLGYARIALLGVSYGTRWRWPTRRRTPAGSTAWCSIRLSRWTGRIPSTGRASRQRRAFFASSAAVAAVGSPRMRFAT